MTDRSCPTGKVRHEARAIATAIAQRRGIRTFKCSACGGWHNGQWDKGKVSSSQIMRRRQSK